MFKALILNQYFRSRVNIIKYTVDPKYREQDSYYTTNAMGMSNVFNNPTTQIIEYYGMTIYCSDDTQIRIKFKNIKDVDEFVDQLLLAEEEQETYSSINVEEYKSYVTEKLLSEKHNEIPGIKIPKIVFKGEII